MLRIREYFRDNNNKNIRKFEKLYQVILLLIISFISVIPSQNVYASDLVNTVQVKKQKEREAFLGFYYDLVKRGHFSPFYPNNLIISADIDYDFPQNGAILLILIEWLEQDVNVASKFLLKKINKYFYLEFHSFISRFEVPKDKRAELYKCLHSLYKYQFLDAPDRAIEGTGNFPFRTALTKIMIAIYMVLYNDHNYIKQRENLVYVIEKIKKELILLNKQHQTPISQKDIEDFIMNLETYVIQEPVVKHVNVKRALIITAIVMLVGGAISYVVYKGGFEWLKDRFYEIAQAIGRGLADTTVDALINRADELGGRLVQGMVREDASNPQAAAGNPNPNIQAMGAELGAGVVQGVWNGVCGGVTYPFRAAANRVRGRRGQSAASAQQPQVPPIIPSGAPQMSTPPISTPPSASLPSQNNSWRNIWGLWK